jgi:xylose isomerase
MKDWCRFSVCYWHTFRGAGADPFGPQTLFRPWDDGSASVANALRRVDAAFEFFTKLGVPYYTFHDVDVAPPGKDLKETNANLDKVVDHLEQRQRDTGVKLLWGTANLFSHWRYANGASTNPDAHVFAYAAAQVKKAMEVTHRLGGENYVFWGGREGYQSVLNTDVRRELDHMARFLAMAVEHKASLGSKFQVRSLRGCAHTLSLLLLRAIALRGQRRFNGDCKRYSSLVFQQARVSPPNLRILYSC